MKYFFCKETDSSQLFSYEFNEMYSTFFALLKSKALALRYSVKKGVLKNFSHLQENTCVGVPFLIKLQK